jgi:hypothetical protein
MLPLQDGLVSTPSPDDTLKLVSLTVLAHGSGIDIDEITSTVYDS